MRVMGAPFITILALSAAARLRPLVSPWSPFFACPFFDQSPTFAAALYLTKPPPFCRCRVQEEAPKDEEDDDLELLKLAAAAKSKSGRDAAGASSSGAKPASAMVMLPTASSMSDRAKVRLLGDV